MIFTGAPLLHPGNSGTQMRTLSPTWPASDLPTLRLRETTAAAPEVKDVVQALKAELLTISVMDWYVLL